MTRENHRHDGFKYDAGNALLGMAVEITGTSVLILAGFACALLIFRLH
ncbi:MAG: hypothetical protein ACM3XS_10105 [Bacteroidota bacterium]